MIKIKFKKEQVFSPLGIYFIYMITSGLAIMAFRFFFPGEAAPLAYFSTRWRLIQGFLNYLDLFPALTLSALVIPFGFKIEDQETIYTHSTQYVQTLKQAMIAAIAASTIYGLLFSLALPVARNFEANLIFEGRLYQQARERAQESAVRGDWAEALHMLNICERIWPGGPEHTNMKIEAMVRTEGERLANVQLPNILAETASQSLGRNVTLNAAEAIAMAETALAEERFFDAHWLATLASRLASPGSADIAVATRLSGRAWHAINSLAPTAAQTHQQMIFRMKREGYEALLAGDWIRSYYIFRDLLVLSPEDPDIPRFLAMSESGVSQVAFFLDELEMSLGRILTGAVFSFPYSPSVIHPSPLLPGRLVMRFYSLSTSSDSAFGIGAEIMAFDSEGRRLWLMEAPYVKIKPFAHDGISSLAILLRALDRTDVTRRWEPEIRNFGQSTQSGVLIVLPVSWDNFFLLTNVRRGFYLLSMAELRTAAENLGRFGYLPQIFEWELLERFVRPLLLLPFGIFAIVMGWQYRALKRPRFMGIVMLGVLPLVFNGLVLFSRNWLNNLGVMTVIRLGFNNAAIIFGAGIVLLLVLSIIALSTRQR